MALPLLIEPIGTTHVHEEVVAPPICKSARPKDDLEVRRVHERGREGDVQDLVADGGGAANKGLCLHRRDDVDAIGKVGHADEAHVAGPAEDILVEPQRHRSHAAKGHPIRQARGVAVVRRLRAHEARGRQVVNGVDVSLCRGDRSIADVVVDFAVAARRRVIVCCAVRVELGVVGQAAEFDHCARGGRPAGNPVPQQLLGSWRALAVQHGPATHRAGLRQLDRERYDALAGLPRLCDLERRRGAVQGPDGPSCCKRLRLADGVRRDLVVLGEAHHVVELCAAQAAQLQAHQRGRRRHRCEGSP
mmetsp:Transcript_89487/g.248933  ORF Transcript_89487/g.248933 Transcript_89487/m.248933 type:complete len:304 (-) Transcript_89487:130-1041(-)